MLRSMYSGISGMKVNQTKLDVIGNNIANVGTTSFKSQRARFTDMLSQNVKNAMAPTNSQGGTNSSQVGLGSQLASIDTIMTYGNLQSTGRTLDVAIDKGGFFIVSNGPIINGDSQIQVNHTAGTHTIDNNSLTNSGASLMYTRDGSFIKDSDGNLLTGDGYRIMGYSLTNDDSSKSATEQSSNNVSAAGFDYKFGPGSQLNGYKIVLGQIGPNTITSATVDKTAKIITVNGDFSSTSTLDATAMQNAISKGLTAAGISQSIGVSGKVQSIEELSTEAIKGGTSSTAPANVTVGGFTLQFDEGSGLNGYKFQVGTINAPGTSAIVNDVEKTVIINGDFVNSGSVLASDLKDIINVQLNAAGITQGIKSISGSATNLSGISAKTSDTVVVKSPTLTDKDGTTGITSNFGTYVIGSDISSGYGATLNGFTLAYGDTSTGTALSVTVDKVSKKIRVDGDMTTVTNTQLETKLNYALTNAGLNAKLTVANGGTGLNDATAKVEFGTDGVNYVKPKNIEILQGYTVEFPTGTDKTLSSALDSYEFVIADINTTPVGVTVDTTNKQVLISGDFVNAGVVTRTDLQDKINNALTAQGITDAIKISGTTKMYTGLVSNNVEGGEDNKAPGETKALNMTFNFTEGSYLNGYKIQVGNITSGTPTTATISANSKTITINGDFVSGTLTALDVRNAINKTLQKENIDQVVTVTGTPIVINGTESDETFGGTPVQSINQNGTINYVDGTNTVYAYDGALKSMKIPEKVKIAGSETELRVTSFTIDKSGVINGMLEDGRVAALGQIAMANFQNPEGLTKNGGNLYTMSVNSGDAIIKSGVETLGDDNSLGYGEMVQSMLEMSNVDLAEQFTDMITATRAFQANSKIINTGDEILQEIINLKR